MAKKRYPDLTGKTFGYLYVEGLSENRYGKIQIPLWRCKCECCGNIKDVTRNHLTSGYVKTCGCRNVKDLTGQKFGRLTVLKQFKEGLYIRCECLCDCGNIITINKGNITNGATVSCGCRRQELFEKLDLTGQRFGKLVVLECVGKPEGSYHYYWKCKCDCGSFVEVCGTSLTGNATRSCGCQKSRLEYECSSYLSDNKYNFEVEKIYKDLYRFEGWYLRFDFAIKDEYNNILCLIECDGIQHYKEVRDPEFGKVQREITDEMKEEYCNNNDIKLFRIRYDDNVIEKLKEIIEIVHANPVPSLYEEGATTIQ